jgi:hypothetical protein
MPGMLFFMGIRYRYPRIDRLNPDKSQEKKAFLLTYLMD